MNKISIYDIHTIVPNNFKYHIIMQRNNFRRMIDWCNKYFGQNYIKRYPYGRTIVEQENVTIQNEDAVWEYVYCPQPVFYFKYKEHLMLFKLVWC